MVCNACAQPGGNVEIFIEARQNKALSWFRLGIPHTHGKESPLVARSALGPAQGPDRCAVHTLYSAGSQPLRATFSRVDRGHSSGDKRKGFGILCDQKDGSPRSGLGACVPKSAWPLSFSWPTPSRPRRTRQTGSRRDQNVLFPWSAPYKRAHAQLSGET